MGNARSLVGNLEGKTLLRCTRRRCENYTKMDLKARVWSSGLHSSSSDTRRRAVVNIAMKLQVR